MTKKVAVPGRLEDITSETPETIEAAASTLVRLKPSPQGPPRPEASREPPANEAAPKAGAATGSKGPAKGRASRRQSSILPAASAVIAVVAAVVSLGAPSLRPNLALLSQHYFGPDNQVARALVPAGEPTSAETSRRLSDLQEMTAQLRERLATLEDNRTVADLRTQLADHEARLARLATSIEVATAAASPAAISGRTSVGMPSPAAEPKATPSVASPFPADRTPAATTSGLLAGLANVDYSWPLWATVDKVREYTASTEQALYETAYALGINRSQVPRQPIADPVPELAPAPDRPAIVPTPAVATVPAAAISPRQAAEAPRAATKVSVPAPEDAVEPGLLTNLVYDRSQRLGDGSFFVPKPLQRLFNLRTAKLAAADVSATMKLPGRIVADPRAHGHVEASIQGRIEPPPEGLPVIGSTVRQGQILGYVEPSVGVVDRTELRRKVIELTTAIRVETENLEILKQFTFVPFRDGKIYQSEQKLAGLRREREALLPMLKTREPLRAPTDGIVSASTAIAGRITRPGEMVFDVVNPSLLWVEAFAPDPIVAENAQRATEASAVTPEGQKLGLSFVGSGLAVQQQSTPVMFRIEQPPAGLRVGRPVTVSVQDRTHAMHGVVVPRDAVTVGSDGVPVVWEQSKAEIFIPHPVRTEDLDGESVLVLDGLPDGTRVAVRGVRLLAQLQ